MENLNGKKVFVFGLGASGIAAYELLKKKKAKVYTFDDVRFPNKTVDIDFCNLDFAIISPGVPNNSLMLKQLERSGVKTISEIEFASNFDEGNIIAITGTNGKTTTTSLTSEIFKECFKHKSVLTAGNIGLPYSSVVLKTNKKTHTILEVSSFQLERIENFKPNIAAILNLAPDHLDRYDTFEDYVFAKTNIFRNQAENDFSILNYNDEKCKKIANSLISNVYYFSHNDESQTENFKGVYIQNRNIYFKDDKIEKLFCVDGIKLIGGKNLENILCAVLIAKICKLDIDKVERAVKNFKPLSNRLEFVKQIKNVSCINDSKATNIASAIADLNAVDGKKVVIFGGSDKGEDFNDLAANLDDDVVGVFVCGANKDKILCSLRDCEIQNVFCCENLKDATQKASEFALNYNDNITLILAPACASFDEFDNYIERGKFFKKCILEISKNKN